MYQPDRVILRKIREYDPHLFIEWNNKDGYFELWRRMVHGRRLITPIVESIYDQRKKKTFIQLDERLVWLLSEWDSWKSKSSMEHVMSGDKRLVEWENNRHLRIKSTIRDLSKDMYTVLSGFYTTKHAAKNPKHPTIKRAGSSQGTQRPMSVRPDLQANTSKRLFSRSKANALRYFGGR